MKEGLIVFIVALIVGCFLNEAGFLDPTATIDLKLPQVTDATFKQEVLDSDQLVLVDFWATWCAPCRREIPLVEEFAAKYQQYVKVVMVDTDKNNQIPNNYQVQGIPNLCMFKNGKLVGRIVGAAPMSELERLLKANL